LTRQFKKNQFFGFVVPLDRSGFASNYSSLTAAFEQFNAATERAPRHRFTGGYWCSSG
jgi:hypothetical protein